MQLVLIAFDMKSNKNSEIDNRKRFSENFKKILSIREISPYNFGKVFSPEKGKSTIGYYYLKNPNITIFNLCKVSIILNADVTLFFQDKLDNIIKPKEDDLEKYYLLVLKNIASNIKEIRKGKDELLLDLEVLSNIDSSNLSKVENAKSNLSISILTRIADTLGTDIQELLSWN